MKVIIIFLLISLGVFSQEITAYGESILKLDKSPEKTSYLHVIKMIMQTYISPGFSEMILVGII